MASRAEDAPGPSPYAKARYFDPKLGRFLTQDSFLGEIDEPPSLHRYLYAEDRPTFYVDPTGHAVEGANQEVDEGAALLARAKQQGSQMSPELAAAQRDYAETTAPPQGVVGEEGWFSRALRKYDEVKEGAKRWARDMGEAVGIKLWDPPSAQSARERESKAFAGRPEAESARRYARGYDIGHGVQTISGEVGAETGERTADAAIAAAEAETGGRLAGAAIGGVKGLSRGVRGVAAEAKTADQAIEAAQAEGRVSRAAARETQLGQAAGGARKGASSTAAPAASTADAAAASDRPIIGGQIRSYDEGRKARIPGYDEHHLDPPLGRNDPGYRTAPTIPVRNDNAGGRVAGGENYHTGRGGFQTALNEHIRELGYTRADWNTLPTETRQIVLKRFYASLGIPYPGRR